MTIQKKAQRVFGAIALASTLQAAQSFAVQPHEVEAERMRAEQYRQQQAPVKLNGWQSYTPNGLTAAVQFDVQVLGDGLGVFDNSRAGLCFEPSSINVRTAAIRQSSSTMEMVQSDYAFSSMLRRQASVNVSGGIGIFSAAVNTSLNIARETDVSSASIAIVARYDYTEGTRWITTPFPTLNPVYQRILDEEGPDAFFRHCGHVYLQQSDEGAALMVVFRLVKNRESRATEAEIKAAVEAKYGVVGGSASASLSSRQREILESFSITSKCYSQGADFTVCDFVSRQEDVAAARSALTAALTRDPGHLASIRTGYAAYSAMISNNVLDSYQWRLNALEAWEQTLSELNTVCSVLDFLPCDGYRAEIARYQAACKDASIALRSCRAPSPTEHILNGDAWSHIGTVQFYEHPNYQGQAVEASYNADNKSPTALKPNVLYSLNSLGFNDRVSSVRLRYANGFFGHWNIELYEHEDGSGRVWTTRSLGEDDVGSPYVGDGFTDKASSFRIVRRRP